MKRISLPILLFLLLMNVTSSYASDRTQTEDYTITQAKFPNLSNYVVLVDGEAIVGHDTVSRIFSMSPYNFYECVLWKVGDALTVDSIVVKNSLLDNDVVHHIGVVPRL